MSTESPQSDAEIQSPEILSIVRSDAQVELKLLVPDALLYFRGHFPGFAILPGVVQLHWAIQYGTAHFIIGAASPSTIRIKFRKPIRPNHRVTLTLKHVPARNSIQFDYTDADGACSSGQVGFSPA